MTDSARVRALELAVGRFMDLPEILNAAHKFAEFIHAGTVGATESPKASAATSTSEKTGPSSAPVTTGNLSTTAPTVPGSASTDSQQASTPRAEDRVPKAPPKRTSKEVGKKPAPAAESQAATTTATTASPSEKVLTLDDVRTQLVAVQTKAGTKEKVFEIIKKHSKDGGHSLASLEAAQFGNVIASAKAYLAS
jgi:hypothetical protein